MYYLTFKYFIGQCRFHFSYVEIYIIQVFLFRIAALSSLLFRIAASCPSSGSALQFHTIYYLTFRYFYSALPHSLLFSLVLLHAAPDLDRLSIVFLFPSIYYFTFGYFYSALPCSLFFSLVLLPAAPVLDWRSIIFRFLTIYYLSFRYFYSALPHSLLFYFALLPAASVLDQCSIVFIFITLLLGILIPHCRACFSSTVFGAAACCPSTGLALNRLPLSRYVLLNFQVFLFWIAAPPSLLSVIAACCTYSGSALNHLPISRYKLLYFQVFLLRIAAFPFLLSGAAACCTCSGSALNHFPISLYIYYLIFRYFYSALPRSLLFSLVLLPAAPVLDGRSIIFLFPAKYYFTFRYFYSALPRSLLFSLLLLPAAPVLDRRSIVFLFPALTFILLYSFLPHKELRYSAKDTKWPWLSVTLTQIAELAVSFCPFTTIGTVIGYTSTLYS
jgi:hypothetical protein